MIIHHPHVKKKLMLITEAPDEISPDDISEIEQAGQGDNPPGETDNPTEDNPEGEDIPDGEEDPNLSGDEDTTGGEDPTMEDPMASGMDDSDNSTLGNDETRKLQLLNLYIQLKDIVSNNIEIVKKLPFINSENYSSTVTFVERTLRKLLTNINYLIAYRYGTISYLDARKVFLNFKLTVVQLVRIVNLLATYTKDNEINSIKQINNHKEKITSIIKFFEPHGKKKNKK